MVAPDLPGRGRSEWLSSPTHYTDRAYTRAMSTLIARLDVEQVDWVGTSLGGHIGMLLAAEAGSPIRRLVLNDFGARVSAVCAAPHRRLPAPGLALRLDRTKPRRICARSTRPSAR